MTIERFRIHIPDAMLEDLQERLQRVRWPEQPAGLQWERGTNLHELQALVSYWQEEYDWRKQESQLNRLSQYRCTIDDIDVHFIHERGHGPHPIPIILTHGWPDSFLRYQKIIPMLTDPASYGGRPEDAFDVIVPSIPGFGFSGRPTKPNFNNLDISELWVKLMTSVLGYSRFAAAGGDIGSGVTRYLAANHPDLLYGIHLTDIGIIRDLIYTEDENILTEEERQYKSNVTKWMAKEGGYMSIQSTKPQTLAYALSDSPVGLAGWILEKFRSWSDCGGNLWDKFSRDDLLTAIMIYWVTNTIGSSVQLYYDNSHNLPPIQHIDVPVGMALFPADIAPPPQSWTMRHLNVARWTQMNSGGHFTAMEEPEQMVDDIRAFYRTFRV